MRLAASASKYPLDPVVRGSFSLERISLQSHCRIPALQSLSQSVDLSIILALMLTGKFLDEVGSGPIICFDLLWSLLSVALHMSCRWARYFR
jgi:hypothetical protein